MDQKRKNFALAPIFECSIFCWLLSHLLSHLQWKDNLVVRRIIATSRAPIYLVLTLFRKFDIFRPEFSLATLCTLFGTGNLELPQKLGQGSFLLVICYLKIELKRRLDFMIIYCFSVFFPEPFASSENHQLTQKAHDIFIPECEFANSLVTFFLYSGCFICVCAFCIDACKDAVHVCPSCAHILGRKNLI